MEKKLQILYNTLMDIEVRGNGAKLMVQCLKYLENLIIEERDSNTEKPEKQELVEEQ